MNISMLSPAVETRIDTAHLSQLPNETYVSYDIDKLMARILTAGNAFFRRSKSSVNSMIYYNLDH